MGGTGRKRQQLTLVDALVADRCQHRSGVDLVDGDGDGFLIVEIRVPLSVTRTVRL